MSLARATSDTSPQNTFSHCFDFSSVKSHRNVGIFSQPAKEHCDLVLPLFDIARAPTPIRIDRKLKKICNGDTKKINRLFLLFKNNKKGNIALRRSNFEFTKKSKCKRARVYSNFDATTTNIHLSVRAHHRSQHVVFFFQTRDGILFVKFAINFDQFDAQFQFFDSFVKFERHANIAHFFGDNFVVEQ